MLLFLIINSFILFILIQCCGVPLSNLLILEKKYDIFKFSENKTSSGINIIYNVIFCNVYMLLIYQFNRFPQYNMFLYWIIIGYLIIRYTYIIIILNRLYLLKLKYECSLIFLTLLSTYWVFHYIISENISLLIPIKDFKNELVLIILFLCYDVAKNILVNIFDSRESTSNRERYVFDKYANYLKKYNSILDMNIEKNKATEYKKNILLLTYSILIYENFARPKSYRMIENLLSKFSSNVNSFGIMQVHNESPLSDIESVIRGNDIIINSLHNYIADHPDINIFEEYDYRIIYEVVDDYNPSIDNQYKEEVLYIYEVLKKYTLES